MKKMLLILLCSGQLMAIAQVPQLSIATDKTSSLIFPFPVKHVDRGSADVLVQQVPSADHILLVKAATAQFRETNLSVILGNGQLYTFRVCYEKEPAVWVHELSAPHQKTMAEQAASLLDNPATLTGIRTINQDVTAGVTGLYVKGDLLYLQLQINNTGTMDYHIDYLRFYLRDQKKWKRAALQELEQIPRHIAGQQGSIKGGSQVVLVIVLEKLAFSEGHRLVIEVGEQKGSRHLELKLGKRHLMQAQSLP